MLLITDVLFFLRQNTTEVQGSRLGGTKHWMDSTGTLERLTLLNYNTRIIIIACKKVQFRQTDRFQFGKALELKIL